MADHYFERVREQTGSRFWVNNPTSEEMDLALQHGAMGCTTNPAYGGNLVTRAPDQVLPYVQQCLTESEDVDVVADHVQRLLVGRICERFMPLFERSGGREGFVSIQGAPEADTDGHKILEEGRVARTIAPNATPKIPATKPGLEALEVLVEEGSQVIVTEVFSVAQVREVCERWLAVTERTGVRPPFMMSPITGIFGDHLKKVAVREGIEVPGDHMPPDELMELAGVVVSRACYRVVRENDYPVMLLYGGARTQFDFSGLVGGGMAATINWSTAAELIAADPPVSVSVEEPVDPAVVARLEETFPDVRRALDPNGLSLDEYEDFGPVQHFRDNFIAGWDAVRRMIGDARTEAVV